MTLQTAEPECEKALRKGIEVTLFLVILAMVPFTTDPTGDVKYLILSWASLLLTAGWLAGVWRAGQRVCRPLILLEVLILLLALNLIASARGPYLSVGLAELSKFWSLFLLYLVASQVYRTPAQIRRMMLVVCVAVALSSCYALFMQRLGYDPFPWSDRDSDVYTNLPGTFGNPNYAAHTLILAIIMAVYLATERSRLWCLGLAGLFFVHLWYTRQRGGLVALAAAAGLLLVAKWIWARAGTKRPVRATVVTLLTVGLLGAVGLVGLMGANKLRTGTPYPLQLSLLVRYKSYCSAARMILTRPLLGYGTGVYKIEYPPFWTPYEQKWFAQELKMNAHVHNDLLEIAADAGLPAAGLYLALLVLGIGCGLYLGFAQTESLRRRLGFTFAVFFCAFLVDGLFGFNLRVPVSAAILFVMAGALEGFWSSCSHPVPPRRPAWLPSFWRPVVLVTALLSTLLGSGVFLSQALLQRGGAELHAKRLDRAETFLRWGEWLYPGNWDFARQRGLAALGKQDWAAAERHLKRALEKNPHFIMTLVPLAQAHLSRGLVAIASATSSTEDWSALDLGLAALDEAAGYARQALDVCPMFSLPEDMLGRASAARAMALSKAPDARDNQDAIEQAWRDAETHFTRAIHYGAKHTGDLYGQLAQVRTALRDQAGAEEAFVRATQADPVDDTNWPPFYRFARHSQRYDRFKNALSWRIKRLAEQSPADAQTLATAYLWLADIEQDAFEDLDAAETAYRSAVHHTPRRPDVWADYARFAHAASRQESFRSFLKETNTRILADGKKPLPHMAALIKVLNRGPEALLEASALLVAVVQGKVRVPGYTPVDLDMMWAVRPLLEVAASADLPAEDLGFSLLHLGMVCAALNELEVASRVFPAAMPKLPDDLRTVCAQHWADVLIRQGRSHEAVNLLRDVVARAPDNTDLKLALARALAKCGRTDEAVAAYRDLSQSPSLSEQERARIQAESETIVKR